MASLSLSAAAAVAPAHCQVCSDAVNQHNLFRFPHDPSLPGQLRNVTVHASCGEGAAALGKPHLELLTITQVRRAVRGRSSGSQLEAALNQCRCAALGRKKYFLMREVEFRLGLWDAGKGTGVPSKPAAASSDAKLGLPIPAAAVRSVLHAITATSLASVPVTYSNVAVAAPGSLSGLTAASPEQTSAHAQRNACATAAHTKTAATAFSPRTATVDPSATINLTEAASPEAKKLKTKKPTKPKPEKRLKRYRSKATAAISQRISRARTQRLYLVRSDPVLESHSDYGGPSCTMAVLGSTGNVYHVTLCKVPHCTCPDHDKGNLCKHILFVMMKVVGLPYNSDLVFQAALLTTELEEVFRKLSQRRAVLGMTDAVANKAVQEQYAKLTGAEEEKGAGEDTNKKGAERKSLDEMADCAICFDPLGKSLSGLTYCRAACGTNFHSHCITQWTSQTKRSGGDVTCPACRAPWLDLATGGTGGVSSLKKRSMGDEGDEGYTNLGSLQGQSPDRDTSTYSEWYQYGGGWGSGGRYGRRRRW